jgi:hypothetical protein
MRIKILLLLVVCVICLLPLQVFAQCTEGNCTDGKGTMIFSDGGAKYVGEFKKGMRHGKGTMMFADTGTPGGQKQFEGQWKEDQPNGKGTLTFYDGRKFVGEWKFETVGGFPVMERRVIVSSRGTMSYPDGRKETGEFINNQFFKKSK